MEDDILIQLVNATRPFTEFECKAGDKLFKFHCRRSSAAESAICNDAYNAEYARVMESLENEDSQDLSTMRRSFEKQKQEKLVDFIVRLNRQEYLEEASSQLDDLPFTDPRVVTKANEIQETTKGFLLKAPFDEVVDKALEKRAEIFAEVKANNVRNAHIVYFSLHKKNDEGDFVRAFPSADAIIENLDNNTIETLLTSTALALGDQKADPLKLVDKKSSRGRSQSPKASAAV